MRTATSYAEWQKAALMLDEIRGRDKWKQENESTDYDFEFVEDKLLQLDAAFRSDNLDVLLFLLNTCTTRNIGNIGNQRLHSYCSTGTKSLIEEYTSRVGALLKHCAAKCQDTMPLQQQLEIFRNIRFVHGNTALLLSGGAALGIHHLGVVKCLAEQKLIPRIISGSSSGSIIASMVCTRTDSELGHLFDATHVGLNVLGTLDEGDHSSPGLFSTLRRLFSKGLVLDSDMLSRSMRENLGDITFLEAYNKTQRILNITVTSVTMSCMSKLLNYITSPNVVIWSAVVASCAIPGIFECGKLLVKHPSGALELWNGLDEHWIDGSVENDLPIKKLAQMFNVNNTIVSQVNPHVTPFINPNPSASIFKVASSRMLFLIKSELQHRLLAMIRWKLFPRASRYLLGVLSQQYQGNVTIVPSTLALKDLATVLSFPDPAKTAEGILKGERATWPNLSLIKTHTWIELRLDEILREIRIQLLGSDLDPRLLESLVCRRNIAQSNVGLDELTRLHR